MSVQYLTSEKELKETKSDNIVLDFTASWCGPCEKISPYFESLSQEDKFKHIKFYKVDADECSELGNKYKIRLLPTFILLKKQKQVDEYKGSKINILIKKLKENFCN